MTRTRLEELAIRSLGVIDDAVLELAPGFTAITGETGAGKTMVVQALSLLRGARADAGLIRAGDDRAAVQGVWMLDDATDRELVDDAGGVVEDGELLVARSVSREGRSRAQIGGANVPAASLQSLADSLVAVHGQSDQQRLRGAQAQLAALDRAAGEALAALLVDYRAHLHAWRDAERELTTITTERDARRREADDLRTELEALEAIDPQPGEDAELDALAHRLEHVESLRAIVAEAHTAITGEDGLDATTLVGTARRLVERGERDDAALATALSLLADAEAAVQEAAAELTRYADTLEAPERPIDEIQERRAALAPVVRRYDSIEAALEHGRLGALRLVELDADDERTVELEQRIAAERDAADALAARITEVRTASAAELEERVQHELRALAMPDARLRIAVTPGDEHHEHGRDDVAILLAPHPGAEPRPVAKAASGGELSRVMLALEVALAADDVPTFVFDEVDAGVGGASAIEIGRRLAALAQHAQVIVVTHLAQVAAFADRHITVVKATDGSVTASSVHTVRDDARVEELARMLAGTASDTALAHAAELLADAHAAPSTTA
ncbi:DNA repair protein RecN [Agrococcus jejuensis]|uniref:DNA repair protein RecN n=1 Tax=Agrococcus jejuensis TaxID=399736 RepID=UPI0028D3B999|nr:DNA repair protein RecN [Agrococcus jejuensis]